MSLDVPYLPQTGALCGGAAVAMLFRYWGDRHADVTQFAPLVDRRAGGIRDVELVAAIRQRGWRARRLDGSIETIRLELSAGHPLILLLEERQTRYHYVVAVAAGPGFISVHDPAWGPSRRLSIDQLLQRWTASGFRALLVLPAESSLPAAGRQAFSTGPPAPSDQASDLASSAAEASWCNRLIDDAVDEIRRRGPAIAEEILTGVRARCPSSSRPLSELAGVKFSARQWQEAESTAAAALRIDRSDSYAWDVLGSSRFIRDDAAGALRAWNQIGQPRLDVVHIKGLTRTRYALVAESLGLAPNGLLTPDAYARAERRVENLPDVAIARLGFRPDADGFGTVHVTLLERHDTPRGAAEWASAAAESVIDREVRTTIPGSTGQGEVWMAGWRWWTGRPRVALSFAAPHLGGISGVWRVDGSWSRESFATAPHSIAVLERTRGGLSLADWMTGQWRYEVSAGMDTWRGLTSAASFGGALERRVAGDRVAIAGSVDHWVTFARVKSAGPEGLHDTCVGCGSFQRVALHASARSSTGASGLVHTASLGLEAVSAGAPLSLWTGAGEGQARTPLLRAHTLLDNGVVAGTIFGRRVTHLTVESERWLARPALLALAVAAFADVAHAALRLPSALGEPLQVDVGAGVRLRAPGRERIIRIDYAHGLRDGHNSVSVGTAVRFGDSRPAN